MNKKNSKMKLKFETGQDQSNPVLVQEEQLEAQQFQKESTVNEVEEYLRANYVFKFNIITGKVLYQRIDEVNFTELTEYDINSLLREMKKVNIKCSRPELVHLLLSDFSPKFNPFLQYLEGLPEWDGETDYISNLAGTVQTCNQALWEKCISKWLIALVGSLKDDNTVNQVAPVFCGGQGVGKTRWIGNLVPGPLKDYFFSGTINMSNKDSISQLSECMLIDMDELENLGKKSIGDLKSLMTRQHIRLRRPYGRMFENLPRRASFVGSINHKEFLKDETGSRRFLCFEVNSINVDHGIDIDKLYSQALALYLKGEQYWFNAEEIKEIEESNEQFQKSFMEAELLWKHFAPCDSKIATVFLTATEIAQVLKVREHMTVSNATVQSIGKALAGKKFTRLKKRGVYVWAVMDRKEGKKKNGNNNSQPDPLKAS
jgi:predicted P-loop ATPase